MRVLIVEDNIHLAAFIQKSVRSSGIETALVSQGADALDMLDAQPCDLVILDLGLPDMDGMEVLKKIRGRKNMIPILILTAREGISDRVNGLNNGADDYLLKPFAMDELVARAKALLRRPRHGLSQLLTAGNTTLDTIHREVQIKGQVVSFSRRETDMLERFLQRPGHVLSKAVLEDNLYMPDEEGSAHSIEVIISRLRKKLVSGGSNLTVHTLRGIGYLLSEQEKADAE